MKYTLLIVTVLATASLSSCFKDEPANAECDITEAWVHVDNPLDLFFSLGDTLVNVPYDKDKITFHTRKGCDLSALAPQFKITDGATMTPANGSVHDFSKGGIIYNVTSEDGAWSRAYTVAFESETQITGDTLCLDFENYALDKTGKYYEWTETDSVGKAQAWWATGNPGFRLTKGSALPDEYPTVPLAEGYDGAAVKLTTCDTGAFGSSYGKPLAAGNLFIGDFNVTSALLNAMKATRFGKPILNKKPIKLTGYYKYSPGEHFQDKDQNIIANRKDSATIYAVLYRNTDSEGNAVTLYGDNVQTSEYVVAVAKMETLPATDVWTPFECTFNYRSDVDADLLAAYGYNFTVVCSSSVGGATFEGAIGSTLCVDKFRIICEKAE